MDFLLSGGPCSKKESSEQDLELSLKSGYLQMSQINQSLAEEGLASDNASLFLSEQKLTECEE